MVFFSFICFSVYWSLINGWWTEEKKLSHLWFHIIWMFVIENDGARQRYTYNQMLWYDKTNVRATSFQFHFFSFFRSIFGFLFFVDENNFVEFCFVSISSNSIKMELTIKQHWLGAIRILWAFFPCKFENFFSFSFLNKTNETIWQLDKDESI